MALLRLIGYELRRINCLDSYNRMNKYNETHEILKFAYNKANN